MEVAISIKYGQSQNTLRKRNETSDNNNNFLHHLFNRCLAHSRTHQVGITVLSWGDTFCNSVDSICNIHDYIMENSERGRILMKIAPVGRKRDIQIAKLKFQKPVRVIICGVEHWQLLREHETFGEQGVAKTRRHKLPYCSTMPDGYPTKDTWELWNELPTDKIYFEYEDGGCALRYKCFTVTGKDFADCVSQAWIIWKEGK